MSWPQINDEEYNKSIHCAPSTYLVLLLIIAAFTRIPFAIHGFGESDSARILITAIDSVKYNVLREYQTDVVPGYTAIVTYLLRIFGNDYNAVMLSMNYLNVFLGICIVIPSYYYIYSITKNGIVSFYTTLMFIFAPAVWQASTYGFPSLISLFFLTTSLWSFASFYDTESKRRYIWLAVSLCCIFLLFIIKADILLNIGAFLGTATIKGNGRKNALFALIFIAASCLGCLLLRGLLFGVSDSAQSGSINGVLSYITLFKHVKGQSYYTTHFQPILYGTGIATIIVFILSIVPNYIHNKKYLLLCVLWIGPPTIFWSLLSENTARHNMASVLPEVLLVVLVVSLIASKVSAKKYILSGSILMLIAASIFTTKPSTNFISPSGNIIKSSKMYTDQSARFATNIENLLILQKSKICFLGGWENPFVIYEILKNSKSYRVERLKEWDHYRIDMTAKNGKNYTWMIIYPRGATKEEGIQNALIQYKDYNLSDYLIVTSASGAEIQTKHL